MTRHWYTPVRPATEVYRRPSRPMRVRPRKEAACSTGLGRRKRLLWVFDRPRTMALVVHFLSSRTCAFRDLGFVEEEEEGEEPTTLR